MGKAGKKRAKEAQRQSDKRGRRVAEVAATLGVATKANGVGRQSGTDRVSKKRQPVAGTPAAVKATKVRPFMLLRNNSLQAILSLKCTMRQVGLTLSAGPLAAGTLRSLRPQSGHFDRGRWRFLLQCGVSYGASAVARALPPLLTTHPLSCMTSTALKPPTT